MTTAGNQAPRTRHCRRTTTPEDHREVQASARASRARRRHSRAGSPSTGRQNAYGTSTAHSENLLPQGGFSSAPAAPAEPSFASSGILRDTQPRVRGFVHYAADRHQFTPGMSLSITFVNFLTFCSSPCRTNSMFCATHSTGDLSICHPSIRVLRPALSGSYSGSSRSCPYVVCSRRLPEQGTDCPTETGPRAPLPLTPPPTQGDEIVLRLVQDHAPQLPPARRPYREPAGPHDLGRMDTTCVHCGAAHWLAERLSESSASCPLFGFCCDKGQVSLDPLPEPPLSLRTLLAGDTPQASEFQTNIRQYNAAFAFTSLGVSVDDSVSAGRGPYVFRIHGELCH